MLAKTVFNRRRLLVALWSLPLVAAACQLLRMLSTFTLAGDGEVRSSLFDLGPISELPEKMGEPLYHRRGRFWLLHNEDGVLAISNTCSHLECLFTWDKESGSFVCPCHGSKFDRHGQVLSGPASRDLTRYRLQLIDGEGVVLATGEPVGEGLPLPNFEPTDGENGSQAAIQLRVDTSTDPAEVGA